MAFKFGEKAGEGKKPKFALPQQEKCKSCEKTVYAIERIVVDKEPFHKTCFRCSHCNRTLSTGNYASANGKLFCKPHFQQLFKLKGNYSEGFGVEQPKNKWHTSEDEERGKENSAEQNPSTPGDTDCPSEAVTSGAAADAGGSISDKAALFGGSQGSAFKPFGSRSTITNNVAPSTNKPFGDSVSKSSVSKPFGDSVSKPFGDTSTVSNPFGDTVSKPFGNAVSKPFGDSVPKPFGDSSSVSKPFGDSAPKQDEDSVPKPFGDSTLYGDATPKPFGDSATEGGAAPFGASGLPDATPRPGPSSATPGNLVSKLFGSSPPSLATPVSMLATPASPAAAPSVPPLEFSTNAFHGALKQGSLHTPPSLSPADGCPKLVLGEGEEPPAMEVQSSPGQSHAHAMAPSGRDTACSQTPTLQAAASPSSNQSSPGTKAAADSTVGSTQPQAPKLALPPTFENVPTGTCPPPAQASAPTPFSKPVVQPLWLQEAGYDPLPTPTFAPPALTPPSPPATAPPPPAAAASTPAVSSGPPAQLSPAVDYSQGVTEVPSPGACAVPMVARPAGWVKSMPSKSLQSPLGDIAVDPFDAQSAGVAPEPSDVIVISQVCAAPIAQRKKKKKSILSYFIPCG